MKQQDVAAKRNLTYRINRFSIIGKSPSWTFVRRLLPKFLRNRGERNCNLMYSESLERFQEKNGIITMLPTMGIQ